jgi:hypothetical protein
MMMDSIRDLQCEPHRRGEVSSLNVFEIFSCKKSTG